MTRGIQKDVPIPLYYQLKEILKERIKSGDLETGQFIPSERELGETYDISRPTVRQAINELVTEGFLRKQHGRGTYVAKKKISQWFLENLTSFSEEMAQKGLHYSTTVLKNKVVGINSTLEEMFGEEYREFYLLERLRYVNDEPYVIVTTYIPVALAEGMDEEDLEKNSLYKTLEKNYRLQIGYADRIIEASTVSGEDAEYLAVDSTSAIQLIKTKGYLENDNIFEYSIARYRGDLSNFTVRVPYKSNS